MKDPTNIQFPFFKYLLLLFMVLFCHIQLKAQNKQFFIEPHFKSALNKPQKITQIGKNHYLIDFGKAYFGTVVLKSKQVQKDTLIVCVGEKLSDTIGIDKNPEGTIRYQQISLAQLDTNKVETIHLQANKRNSNPPAIILPDSFGVVMPFRYCELVNLQVAIEDIDIRQKAFFYEFNDKASSLFVFFDTFLNRVWDLCKYSVKVTTFGGYYVKSLSEHIPYDADAYIDQWSHYCVDSVYSVARRTNEYSIEHATCPTKWLLYTVMLFYQDYMYTGDILSKVLRNIENLYTS